MVTDNRITPEWVETLAENEIFVFGCRNSGRHFDGASNFALEHFGAVMGQREGRQGQSYAIPTIGGTIGLRDIRKSVMLFTQYAAEHPELHFLVTPVGCGGGCQSEMVILIPISELLCHLSLLMFHSTKIITAWQTIISKIWQAKNLYGDRLTPNETLYHKTKILKI